MEQTWVAAIAVLSFMAGTVWPRFVVWLNRKIDARPSAIASSVPRPTRTPLDDLPTGKFPSAEDATFRVPTNPHRRVGIAELRARAEASSRAPQEHTSSVTAKNAAALSSMEQ